MSNQRLSVSAPKGADGGSYGARVAATDEMPTLSEHRAYRPDIDGLRAVAVLAVIVYHFSGSALPSGFLGVDVFFVLSGFVITGSLCRQSSMGAGEFLIGFYARRVRRLVPALVVCVLVSALAISLFSPDPSESLKTGMGALFGISNILLQAQVDDYFAAPAYLNVFTHTWSLGVEEQFYVIFPLLLLLLGVLIDVLDDFCPSTTCSYQDRRGQLLYRDITAHPSIEAARLVAPKISSALLKSP